MTTRRGRSMIRDRSVSLCLLVGAVLAGALCVFPSGAQADWTQTFTFDPADLRVSDVRGHEELALRGCIVDASPGAPRLPFHVATFTVPEGEEVVAVDVLNVVSELVPGRFNVLPGGGEHLDLPIEKDGEIWNVDALCPALVAKPGGSGFMAGERIGSVIVYPVQLNPVEGTILFHREVEVRIRTAASSERGIRCERPDVRRSYASGRRSEPGGTRAVPPALLSQGTKAGMFQPTEFPSLDGSLVEYLIITVDELASEFQRLADWKTASGVPAVVKTMSWIEATYPGGVDLPEKIRLFIRDAFQNWGTKWVLLGGDTEHIPIRLAHSDYYSPGDWLITCDMYYQCLDGNWNADGDHLFGEGFRDALSPGDSAVAGIPAIPSTWMGRPSVNRRPRGSPATGTR